MVLTACLGLNACSVFNADPLANDDGSLTYTPNSSKSLWILIGRDLKMNHEDERPEVQQQIEWYMHHRLYLINIAKRADPYVYYILQEVKTRHLPTEIALIPMIESNYDPFAYSNVGAAGLWQMMPGTASGFSLRQNWWYDGRRDIYASTQAALDYLLYLHKLFKGDWLLAIAAYNSGEGTVQNAVNENIRKGLPTDFWHLELPLQTQNYVPKILAIATILANPDEYPIDWPNTSFTPYITRVSVGSQIDLAEAARLAGITTQALYDLNPGYSRWATDPDGEHVLVLPSDKVDEFQKNLAALPASKRVTWRRYSVKTGDSLISIAHHYQTTPALIKQVNNLKTNIIRPEQTLLIPEAQKTYAKDVMNNVQHYLQKEDKMPGPQSITYTVQAGDSLWKIALHYRVSENDIRFWNQLPGNAKIKPGTTLTIWLSTPKKHATTTGRKTSTTHKVVAGETLSVIAKKYHVTTKHLETLNHLQDSKIKVGQTLIIPAEEAV